MAGGVSGTSVVWMDGWMDGGMDGRRGEANEGGNPFGSLPCVIKKEKEACLLQEMGAAERSNVHEAGRGEKEKGRDGWMDHDWLSLCTYDDA